MDRSGSIGSVEAAFCPKQALGRREVALGLLLGLHGTVVVTICGAAFRLQAGPACLLLRLSGSGLLVGRGKHRSMQGGDPQEEDKGKTSCAGVRIAPLPA